MTTMRDPNSGVLYSPSVSGLDPDGMDDYMGLDPNGFRPLAAVDGTRQMPNGHMAQLDVSMLVGVPPPPPKSPPPKKNRRPRPVPQDDSKGVLMPSSVSRVLAMNATPHSNTNSHSYSLDSKHSAPAPRDTKKTMGIAEERRRAALAMYHSEDLVLDNEESFLANELLRPSSMTTHENKPQRNPGRPDSSGASTRSNGVSGASPTSEVTEHHSNQTLHTFTENKEHPRNLKDVHPQLSEPVEDEADKVSDNQDKKKGEAASKKEEKKKSGLFKRLFRGKGKERHNASEKASAPAKHKIDASGAKSTPKNSTPTAAKSSPSINAGKPTFTPTAASQPLNPTPTARSNPQALKPSLKDSEARVYAGRSVSREAGGVSPRKIDTPVASDSPGAFGSFSPSSRTSMVSEKLATTMAPMPPSPTNDVAATQAASLTMLAPSASDASFLSALQTPRADPPHDADYGDPPISLEPPRHSPSNKNALDLAVSASQDEEDESSRIESVRSRIAEVYEGNRHRDEDGGPISDIPNSLLGERPEIFFSQDEVSILTGPSFESLHKKTAKSQGPAPATQGIYSDPFGRYFDPSNSHDGIDGIDPSETDSFMSPFVDEPYMDGLPSQGSLRVDVQDQPQSSQDPVGESPFHDGKRGANHASKHPDPVGDSPMGFAARKASSIATVKDPVGESPVHAAPAKTNAPTPSHKTVEPRRISSEDNGDDQSENFADPPLQHLTAGYISDDSDSSNAEEKKEDPGDVETELIGVPSSKASTKFTEEEDDDGMSSATSAALKLVKPTENGNVKAERDALSKPAISSVSDIVVGPTPVVVPRLIVNTKDTIKAKRFKKSSSHNASEGKAETADKNASVSKREGRTEQSGFRSDSNTHVITAKPLTVSAAAFTNAKAVAYLHRIQGDASPRHSWLSSKKKPEDKTSVDSRPASTKKKDKSSVSKAVALKAKRPSPEEYGAHDPELLDLSSKPKTAKEKLERPPTPEVLAAARQSPHLSTSATETSTDNSKRMFSAYRSKFNGRKPLTKKEIRPLAGSPRVEVGENRGIQVSPCTVRVQQKPIQADSPRTVMKKRLQVVTASNAISSLAVTRGIKLRKNKRIEDIQSGRSTPVILTPKKKPTGGNRFNFVPADESEIKDPIQRAGRRLLSKAAIPIQCAARRYLAKGEAVDRMWALIEVQSYFRRWRSETHLQASIDSATLIQSAFRGWLTRDKVKDMHFCAVQIQRVIRGHLASLRAYDTIYCVVQIQATVRGFLDRKTTAMKNETATFIQAIYRGHLARSILGKSRVASVLQAAYRGYKARQLFVSSVASISLIQTAWRSYSGRIKFQFQIVDIIIAQSVVRRWAASRKFKIMKDSKLSTFSVKIQKVWRGYSARESLMRNLAACRIQATWRGFHCYTDYIFALVDILVVQRTVRQWLAIKSTKELRRNMAALKIQTQWRRRSAQVSMIFSLVNIIIVQSVARRYLSRSAVRERRLVVDDAYQKEQQRQLAATTIQKVWRGFWGFSHYIIMQYEITKVQALIRGKLARQSYSLSLGCAIIIQATARQYIAKKKVDNTIVADAIRASQVVEMRERNASKRIQFWWRIVLDWMKEKKAALTIERFFIHVRREVDREILRREQKKKQSKKEKRRKHRRKESESEESVLEHAWLNTVEEERIDPHAKPVKQDASGGSARSKSVPRGSLSPSHRDQGRTSSEARGLRHRASSPPKKLVMRHEDADKLLQRAGSSSSNRMRPPTDAVRMAPSEDASEVSNLTTPSVFQRAPPPRQLKGSRTDRTELTDEYSREEAYGEPEIRRSKEKSSRKMKTKEDYINKYGMQTAPSRSSQSQHFFSEEAGGGGSSAPRRRSSGAKSQTPSSSRSQNPATTPRSTPRNQIALTPRGSTPVGHHNLPRGQHGAPSPRVHSKDRYNFYPPSTPPRQKTPSNRDVVKHSSSRSHAETADMTSHGGTSHHSQGSPRHSGRGHSVLLMKNYPSPDFPSARSIEESQEVQYLGAEFGEV